MNKSLQSRFKLILTICLAAAVLITAKLFYLQIICHSKFKTRAERVVQIIIKHKKSRGVIYDRNSKILAKSLPTYDCAISKKYVLNPSKLIKVLSNTLGIAESRLQEEWKNNKNFFYIRKGIKPSMAKKLENAAKKENLEGLVLTLRSKRFHPDKDLATDLLGSVNSKNDGVSGIEFLYEDILSADKPSRSKAIKDRYGRVIYETDVKKDMSALNLHLTIDNRAQYIAEKALDDAITKNRAKGGFIIVQNPATGEILASASNPRVSGKANLFQWTYEPGSTFKVVTVSAGLDTNQITPKDEFFCENGKWQFSPSVIINDHEEHGTLNVSDIIKVSSNICASKIALKISKKDMHKYIRAFGFGTKTAISYPGESKGVLQNVLKWKPLDLAVMGFGHGIAVTGIQLVSAFSAIANDGNLIEPTLIKQITDSEGNVQYKFEPRLIRRVVSSQTASKMNKIMQTVIESGTATSAKIRGYSIAGKTGTSRKIDASGEYSTERHIASFCGFLPASNPKFTILVVIDQPETSSYGGITATPAFKYVAKKLLAIYGVRPDIEVRKVSTKKPEAQQI
ncbi:MAG TPA: penicillin-binding protein 2 [Elusimicrobiales bacterium]|nr:penicillin-binding protein 2 [Elusimicrobiales bacterium]